MANTFSRRLIDWYHRHGRKDLPWQHPRDAYRVWISEIMLQQTQVTTVIPYFERFINRFPAIKELAAAPIDDVLGLWSGLGYYARARNLHHAACEVCAHHRGQLPDSIDALTSLPGIGRSTAGAILALTHGQRHPILDGNVKRVLARYHAIKGWSGSSAVQKTLWAHAEAHTPHERVSEYTQAIMDLGAMVCTRSRPRCKVCPLHEDCVAHLQGRVDELPTPKPKRSIPTRVSVFAILRNDAGEVLLERRPSSGIWGGLWSFPECPRGYDLIDWCDRAFGLQVDNVTALEPLLHTFTHFRLNIHPMLMQVSERSATRVAERGALWYNFPQALHLGVAAPVRALLDQLSGN
jgi:A/G-specific adenine glycosylase